MLGLATKPICHRRPRRGRPHLSPDALIDPPLGEALAARLCPKVYRVADHGRVLSQDAAGNLDDVNGKKNTCELGDLLVVHDHLGHRPRRRAAILQAKRTNRGSATATDPVQNDLYRRLPPFSLSRTGYKSMLLKKGVRDVGTAKDFARFALVADDAHTCHWLFSHRPRSSGLLLLPSDFAELRPPWSVAYPKQHPVTTVGSEMLGSFLSSMLFETYPARGQAISPVLNLAAATLGSGQDLNITVQELLDITAKRVAKFKQSWGGLRRGIMAFQDGTLPIPNPGNPFSDLPSRPDPGEEPPDGAAPEDPDEDGEGLPILIPSGPPVMSYARQRMTRGLEMRLVNLLAPFAFVRTHGVEIFFRETGERSKPTSVLLHAISSLSDKYRDLTPLLTHKLSIVAPDYGYNVSPSTSAFRCNILATIKADVAAMVRPRESVRAECRT